MGIINVVRYAQRSIYLVFSEGVENGVVDAIRRYGFGCHIISDENRKIRPLIKKAMDSVGAVQLLDLSSFSLYGLKNPISCSPYIGINLLLLDELMVFEKNTQHVLTSFVVDSVNGAKDQSGSIIISQDRMLDDDPEVVNARGYILGYNGFTGFLSGCTDSTCIHSEIRDKEHLDILVGKYLEAGQAPRCYQHRFEGWK